MINRLILGTAQWGWTLPKSKAFEVLDAFYDKGFRQVDTATNYPINKNAADFRLAEKMLAEWIRANGVKDLAVMIKVGSLNNMRTPETNLSFSFLLMLLEQYQNLYQSNLDTFMIHWDNTAELNEVQETFKIFEVAQKQNIKVGLSGIKNPALYSTVNEAFNYDFCIQIKHNVLQSDYERYAPFHGKARFIGYGTNGGGIKLDPAEYSINSVFKARGGELTDTTILDKITSIVEEANTKPNRSKITQFFQVGMLNAYQHTGIDGIIIAPSSKEQWLNTLNFYEILQQEDFSDVLFQ